MKFRRAALAALLFFSACTSGPQHSEKLYGEMSNDREYGTVVSVSANSHMEVNGLAGATASNTATVASNTAAATVSGASSLLSPVGSMFSALGSYTSSTAPDVTAGDVMQLKYVIRKDDGSTVTINQVPEENEAIAYSGQRVMMQSNGEYLRVYPQDVEHLRRELH